MMYKKFEPVYPYFSIIGGSNQILQVGCMASPSTLPVVKLCMEVNGYPTRLEN
jgi:hypothetical protein